ncbi:vanadium-dependent haloperoxidase [Sungkyunkwania multivorans]|uniref:Vanadium-dependent haloperoxidase n=1 Tax=Sungkyunkwania multivorans TaxID=1173618 RepID=A0ABW3CZP4_9FLAO
MRFSFFIFLILLFLCGQGRSQEDHSIARRWMDVMLRIVQEDGQGPTVQARNYFHTSAAIYDAWAAYDSKQETYFLGKNKRGLELPFDSKFKKISTNVDSLRNIAINYAAFMILRMRYEDYGSKGRTIDFIIDEFERNGGDQKYMDDDYLEGSPEALGNYIGNYVLELGLNDGSREEDRHESEGYRRINPNLRPELPGVGELRDPNHWQPVEIQHYIREKGSDKTLKDWNFLLIPGNTEFLTNFWGEVIPFALEDKEGPFPIHLDPGAPPYLDSRDTISSKNYRWGFQLVQHWSSYLDPDKTKIWDISPRGITSMEGQIPRTVDEYKAYFERAENNERGKAAKNPFTGKKYAKNKVKQGDYVRTIAEFWVDGPNTSSPPGHWLQFLNKVSYHTDFKRKWKGKGPSLSQLEWDVKSYFLMTGTLHDAGIAAWSIKNHYDYVRPITAIRFLADVGQSSNPELPNYNPFGLKLTKGITELVTIDDPLVGANKEHLNKIKIKAWRGPDAVNDPLTDTAGVGWILAENWWPYQRYTFATPPFAGYVSGHSTFSTASAVMLHHITGSPYFPNGLETFTATKNEFLQFEEGPSEDITLQWATFYDAAIETCLSRIWGGIHPPVDDIEGRRVGKKVAENAIEFADRFFE